MKTRKTIGLNFVTVSELSYQELMTGIDGPQFFLNCELRVQNKLAPFLLYLDRVIGFALIEIMMGGEGKIYDKSDITKFEMKAAKQLLTELLYSIRGAWSPIDLKERNLEVDKVFLTSFSDDQKVNIIQYDLMALNVSGALGMVISSNVLSSLERSVL